VLETYLQVWDFWGQAGQLRAELDKMAIPDGALWVTSPLTRAIETMMLARPAFANLEGFPDRLIVRR
jgi:hypothetical protein